MYDYTKPLRTKQREKLGEVECAYRDMEAKNTVSKLVEKHKGEDAYLTDVASELIEYLKTSGPRRSTSGPQGKTEEEIDVN